MLVGVVPIQVGCFVLDGVKLECCWGCIHQARGEDSITLLTCVADSGQALESQEGSYLPQYSRPLTCSGSHGVYVASPASGQ
eukprot:g25949.t1